MPSFKQYWATIACIVYILPNIDSTDMKYLPTLNSLEVANIGEMLAKCVFLFHF